MTHLYAGMKGKTKGGYEFEIFAEREGYWYGRVECLPSAWASDGRCVAGDTCVRPGDYDITAPEPVRKWRWVMRDDNVDDFFVSSDAYASAEDADAGHAEHCKAIQRIDATEICE